MASLLDFVFLIEPCHLRFYHLKTAILAVLELGAPLSSFLEEALYKCSMSEYRFMSREILGSFKILKTWLIVLQLFKTLDFSLLTLKALHM